MFVENMIDWLIDNKEWLFSGVFVEPVKLFVAGVIGIVLACVGGKCIKRKYKDKHSINMQQQNSMFSRGTQIGVQNNYDRKRDKS